eukprot:1626190-Prymnesium_polylepis.1
MRVGAWQGRRRALTRVGARRQRAPLLRQQVDARGHGRERAWTRESMDARGHGRERAWLGVPPLTGSPGCRSRRRPG